MHGRSPFLGLYVTLASLLCRNGAGRGFTDHVGVDFTKWGGGGRRQFPVQTKDSNVQPTNQPTNQSINQTISPSAKDGLNVDAVKLLDIILPLHLTPSTPLQLTIRGGGNMASIHLRSGARSMNQSITQLINQPR